MAKYFIALFAFFWIVSNSFGQEKIKLTFELSKIGFATLINSKPKLDSLGSFYTQFKQGIPDSSLIPGYSVKLDTSLVKKAVNFPVHDSIFVFEGSRFFNSLNLGNQLEPNLFDSSFFDTFSNKLGRLDTLKIRNSLNSIESDSVFVLKRSWYPNGPDLNDSLKLDVLDSQHFDEIIKKVSVLDSSGFRELPGLMDSILTPSSFKIDQIIPSLDGIPTGLGDKFGTVNKERFFEYFDSNIVSKRLNFDSSAVGPLTNSAFPFQYSTDSLAFPVDLNDFPKLDSLNVRNFADGVLSDSLKQIDMKLQEILQPDASLEIPSEEYLRENFVSDTLLNKYLKTFSIYKPEIADWDSDKITESIRSELPPVPEFEKEYQAISTRIVSLKDRDLVDSVRNLVSRKLYKIKDEVQDSLSVYLIAEKEKLKDNLFFEGLVNAEEYAGDLSVTDFSGSLGVKVKQFYEVGVGPEIGVLGGDFSAIGARFFARREVLENRLFAVVENSYRKGSGIPADLEQMEQLYSNWKIGASTLFKLSPSGNTKLNFQTLLNPQYLKNTYANLVDFRFGISKLSKKQ